MSDRQSASENASRQEGTEMGIDIIYSDELEELSDPMYIEEELEVDEDDEEDDEDEDEEEEEDEDYEEYNDGFISDSDEIYEIADDAYREELIRRREEQQEDDVDDKNEYNLQLLTNDNGDTELIKIMLNQKKETELPRNKVGSDEGVFSNYSVHDRFHFGEFGYKAPQGMITSDDIYPTTINEFLLKRKMNINGIKRSELSKQILPSDAGRYAKFFSTAVYGGGFSPDFQTYYSYSQDIKVRLFSTVDPLYPRHTLTFGRDMPGEWTITDCTMSRDNRMVAYSTRSPTVTIYNQSKMKTENIRFTRSPNMSARGFAIYSLAFSPDNRILVAGTGDHGVYAVDLETYNNVTRIRQHKDEVNSICYADDSGNLLFSASDDTSIRLWDIRVPSTVGACGAFLGHTEGVTHIESKGDARYLLSNSKDQSMKLWDVRMIHSRGEANSTKYGDFRSGFDYRFEYYRGSMQIRHPDDGSIATYRGHIVHKTLIRCHFSPKETTEQQYVYSGSADGKIYIWQIGGNLIKVIDPSPNLTSSSAVSFESYKAHESTNVELSRNVGRRLAVHCVRDVAWHPIQPVMYASAWTSARGTWDYRDFSDSAAGALIIIPFNHERVDTVKYPDYQYPTARPYSDWDEVKIQRSSSESDDEDLYLAD